MALQLIKFENSEAWSADTWAIIDTVTDRLMPMVLWEELHGLLFLALIERFALWYERDDRRSWHGAQLLAWLNETAPRFKFSGVRNLPEAWAKALVDTSDWDEEALARPLEIQEHELIELLLDSKRSAAVVDYLLEQFGEWEPAQKGLAGSNG